MTLTVEPFLGENFVSFQPLPSEEIRNLIVTSKPTSCELDPIPTELVLKHLDTLLPVLTSIMNNSLVSGVMPEALKQAMVKPLLKKDNLDPEMLSNYRPVSNLPFLSKVIERAAASQLLQHVNEYNLLDEFQSAYRPGHSTETALLRLVNDIREAADRGEVSLLVLLDLSAAFDTIDHSRLLERLRLRCGISGSAMAWIKSYLADRFQSVQIGSQSSKPCRMTCGVPPGSVLGPILFTIYTSPLGEKIKEHGMNYHFYADDCQLLKSFSPTSEGVFDTVKEIETCSKDIKDWMNNNYLKLNDTKTEAILLGSRAGRKSASMKEIVVGEARINLSSSVKSLGVLLDPELNMQQQVTRVLQNCFCELRNLSKARELMSISIAKSFVSAMILSRLDYCNSLFAEAPVCLIKRLQSVQNAAARVVSRTKKTDHITPILNMLHWLPVRERVVFKIGCLAHACFYSAGPSYLNNIIPPHKPVRNLRSSTQPLLRPRIPCKKSFGSRAFTSVGPTLWNSLPEDLRRCTSPTEFRKQLKTFLFKQTI